MSAAKRPFANSVAPCVRAQFVQIGQQHRMRDVQGGGRRAARVTVQRDHADPALGVHVAQEPRLAGRT
ncbi:MAG TPA: hypothetical protein VFX16_28590, partial [Pseudonocardiaceae bacterium]|nr:hypothetical protein [Pseudonocardiaceae bacterium]